MSSAFQKPVLIIGGSGMLGQSLVKIAPEFEVKTVTMARKSADVNLDISNLDQLAKFDYSPFGMVINTAAISSVDECEKNPEIARSINALPNGVLAGRAEKYGYYFVYISTDHFFTGDGNLKHKEDHPVTLVNQYAKSKYEGENLTLTNNKALVLRTNIIGQRGWKHYPTFMEQMVSKLETGEPITAFDDYYTSTIHVDQLARSLFHLIKKQRPSGILNLASSQVATKKEAVEELARVGGFSTQNVKIGKVNGTLAVKRPESVGLDVSLAESMLGYSLPNLKEVIESVWKSWRR